MSGQGIVGPSPLPTAAALAGLETKIRRRDSTSVGGERKIPGRRGRYRNNLLSSYLSLFFSLSLYLSLFLSLSLTHTHTHSLSHSRSLTRTPTHTQYLPLSLSIYLFHPSIHPSISILSISLSILSPLRIWMVWYGMCRVWTLVWSHRLLLDRWRQRPVQSVINDGFSISHQ